MGRLPLAVTLGTLLTLATAQPAAAQFEPDYTYDFQSGYDFPYEFGVGRYNFMDYDAYDYSPFAYGDLDRGYGYYEGGYDYGYGGYDNNWFYDYYGNYGPYFGGYGGAYFGPYYGPGFGRVGY